MFHLPAHIPFQAGNLPLSRLFLCIEEDLEHAEPPSRALGLCRHLHT